MMQFIQYKPQEAVRSTMYAVLFKTEWASHTPSETLIHSIWSSQEEAYATALVLNERPDLDGEYSIEELDIIINGKV